MPQLGLVGRSLVGPGTDIGPGAPTVFAPGPKSSPVPTTLRPTNPNCGILLFMLLQLRLRQYYFQSYVVLQ